MSVEYSWLPLQNTSIRLLKVGPYNFENPSKVSTPKILLIIPGNPGICQFYEHFAVCLHRLRPDFTICVTSYLNHDYEGRQNAKIQHRSGFKRATLQEQVRHKLDFIVKFIPKTAKLYLAGHSIGAYTVLQNIEPLVIQHGYDVQRIFMLFPVFEHITQTPNGRMFNAAYSLLLHYPAILMAYLLYFLPDSIKQGLIAWRVDSEAKPVFDKQTHNHVKAAAKQLCDGRVTQNVLLLLQDELQQVAGPMDGAVFERYGERMTMIFSQQDGWCPLEFYEHARRRRLADRIVLCEPHVQHAFVVDDSREVAAIVAQELL